MNKYTEYLDHASQDPTRTPSLDLPSIIMPDNGCVMQPDVMRSLGYKYRRESHHPDREQPTAWWWASMKLYEKCLPAIVGKGFVFTSDIETI